MSPNTTLKGYRYAILAMTMWGMFPIYWSWLNTVHPVEVLAHRTLWCAVFTLAVLALQRRVNFSVLWHRPAREWWVLTGSAIMVSSNWGVFIYAVQQGEVIQGSLGYFLSPLMSIVLGRVIFKEHLSNRQWLAISFASAGVMTQILAAGVLPWIGLFLGLTFALYGALRKFAQADSLTGLLIETSILSPLALAYILWTIASDTGSQLLQQGTAIPLLLLLGGVVTALPLMLYVAATRLLALTVVGFLFYINPSIQFLIGRFLFDEPLNPGQLLGFVLIWSGLALFTWDNLRNRKRLRKSAA